MQELIDNLRRLQAAATPGTWYLSELDGAWAAAVESPVMAALAASLGTKMGGPERPIGECDFAINDEAYALACVNAAPLLIAEIERLRRGPVIPCCDCGANVAAGGAHPHKSGCAAFPTMVGGTFTIGGEKDRAP